MAIPLALASHFVLDSLPHFGFKNWEERKKHKNLLEIIVGLDLVMLVFVVALLVGGSFNWLVLVCAFAAISPDMGWVYRYIVQERFGRLEPTKGNRFTRFHKRIQKREFPKGFLVEYAAFAVLMTMVVSLA